MSASVIQVVGLRLRAQRVSEERPGTPRLFPVRGQDHPVGGPEHPVTDTQAQLGLGCVQCGGDSGQDCCRGGVSRGQAAGAGRGRVPAPAVAAVAVLAAQATGASGPQVPQDADTALPTLMCGQANVRPWPRAREDGIVRGAPARPEPGTTSSSCAGRMPVT